MAGLLGTVVLASLARGVLAAFPAASKTCSSTDSTSWEIKKFTVDTNSKFFYGNGTVGKASFTIKNTANGYEFNCLQGDGRTGRVVNRKVVGGKVWYSCNVFCPGARGLPKEDNPPLATSFHFDVKTKALSVNQTWSCGPAGAAPSAA